MIGVISGCDPMKRAMSNGRLNHASINGLVKEAEYAVRGAIVTRSQELAKELKKPNNTLPFKRILSCNIGVSTCSYYPS